MKKKYHYIRLDEYTAALQKKNIVGLPKRFVKLDGVEDLIIFLEDECNFFHKLGIEKRMSTFLFISSITSKFLQQVYDDSAVCSIYPGEFTYVDDRLNSKNFIIKPVIF